MLRITIEEAETGMVVATPVYHPEYPDRVLLRPGFEITEPVLRRLKDMGVGSVWIQYPALDTLDRYLSKDVLAKRAELAQHVKRAFEVAQSDAAAGLNCKEYQAAVADLINSLLSNPTCVIVLDEMAGTNGSLMNHSLRVCYMSVLMGLKLDAYLMQQRKRLDPRRAKQVVNLGLGAMLHDIGWMQMDKADGPEPHPLDDDGGNDAWRQHVALGSKMIRQRIEPTAHAIVMHHHQHYDGSGFPRTQSRASENQAPLQGDSIHIYPRIVCVADTFDRLRHPADRPDPTMVQAVGAMFAPPLVERFDPVVLQAFARITPPFPPGTKVTLSDERSAAVITHNPHRPCRPMVQILDSADGAQAGLVDLVAAEDLSIARVGNVDVTGMLYELPEASPAFA